ncbi:MAG: fibronectin type III domain-containing protein, partial [Bacteroidota bacterium]
MSWNSSTGATSYRVQVSRNSNFSPGQMVQDVMASGTSTTVSGLSNQSTYYWRVNATNTAGSSDWSSAWSITTASSQSGTTRVGKLDDPDPPTNLQVSSITSTSATLGWSGGSPEVKFDVQVSPGSLSFPGINSNSVVASPLSPNTEYTWQVRSTKGDNASSWVAGPRFKTLATPPPRPTAPRIISPLAGATAVSTSPTLEWSAVTGADKYHVTLSEKQNYQSAILDADFTQTSTGVTGLATEKTYYWKVTASNASGTSEPAEATFTTISTKPASPSLNLPANGATGVSTSPTLSWNASTG